MKKQLTVFLLISNSLCFAQGKIKYADFLQTDTSVKWAAIYNSYVNLTPVNPNFNIRNFYINKLKQKGATAYFEDKISFTVTPLPLTYNDYKVKTKAVSYNEAKMNWRFYYDEKSNAAEMIFNLEANSCDTCFLNNKLSFFKVKQLLYYKDNQLKIRNILLSPVTYKKQSKVFKEGTEYYENANFAFNDLTNTDASIPSTAKFIGRSSNNLVLLPSVGTDVSESNILTLNNWNLASVLYNDIKKKIVKAYSTEQSIYPDQKNILDIKTLESYKIEPIEVAFYDSTGNMLGYKKMLREIPFDSIYNFTLVQDFYFDFDKELLYSKLVALAPRIRVETSSGDYLGLTDYWGVIFPKEKIKSIKKTK